MRSKHVVSIGLASLLGLALSQGCSNDSEPSPAGVEDQDAAPGTDSGGKPDGSASTDGASATDATVDGTLPPSDSGNDADDATVDGAVDAGTDAKPDAPADAAPDVKTDAGECGNGVVVSGEACDDGNGNNDDGCGGNCTNVNGNPVSGGSCPGHPVHLWANQTVTGTGANNAAGYANTFTTPSVSCTLGQSNAVTDHVYEVTPHASGTVSVTLSTAFNLNLVARTICNDGSTTTANRCKDKTQTLVMAVTSGVPVYIAVDGGSLANNVGTYTITFTHAP